MVSSKSRRQEFLEEACMRAYPMLRFCEGRPTGQVNADESRMCPRIVQSGEAVKLLRPSCIPDTDHYFTMTTLHLQKPLVSRMLHDQSL